LTSLVLYKAAASHLPDTQAIGMHGLQLTNNTRKRDLW
jgi:hypothetical protein